MLIGMLSKYYVFREMIINCFVILRICDLVHGRKQSFLLEFSQNRYYKGVAE